MFKNFLQTWNSSSTKNKFSLAKFQQLDQQLSKTTKITEQNQEQMIETVRSIAELMVWGDQNDSQIVDYFLEHNVLSKLFNLLETEKECTSAINKQLIQSLAMLFHNLNNKDAIYFMMSNNHLNTLITHKFDFSEDELLDYYITFLKALALKFDKDIIQFFFNREKKKFPLFEEAIKFFNYGDSMVRAAIRTITLKVYEIEGEEVRDYLYKKSQEYFPLLMKYIKSMFETLDELMYSPNVQAGRLEDAIYEQLDQFYYINDLFHLNIEHLNVLLYDTYTEIIFDNFIKSLKYVPELNQVTPMVKKNKGYTQNITPLLEMKKENYDCIIPKKFTEQSQEEEESEEKGEESTESEDNIETKQEEENEDKVETKQEEVKTTEEQQEKEQSKEELDGKEEEMDEETIENKIEEEEAPEEINEKDIEKEVENNLNQEINEKLILQPLNMEQSKEDEETVFEEVITPPTTPKKHSFETHEYISHKLSLYLLSHSIQTFDHELLIEKVMKLVLHDDFLNLIYSKILTGNDSLVYSSLCLLYSISSHKVISSDKFPNKEKIHKEEKFITTLLNSLKSQNIQKIINFHLIMRYICELNEEQKIIFKECFFEGCRRLNSYLSDISDISIVEFYTFMEQEYGMFKHLKSTSNTRFNDFYNDNSIFIGQSSNELYKRKPMNKNENIKVDCHFYFILMNIYSNLMLNEEKKNELFNQFELIFPESPKHSPGAEIKIDDLELHFKCNIYIQVNKQTISVPRLIILEDNYMFIVEINPKNPNIGKIKASVPLLFARTQTNTQHRYTLRILAERLTKNGTNLRKIFECILVFDNIKMSKKIKTLLDDYIDTIKKSKTKELLDILQIEKYYQ